MCCIFLERYENNEFDIMFQELNMPFTHEELIKSIKQLKNNKAGGPDMHLNEFFIHGKDILVPYLVTLFNKIFELGYFPETWSDGFIVPLHKKGSLNDVNNYRGITLLSALGKLFTRVLNNRLTDWAEKYSVYIESQAGFRSNMGTSDNIFALHGLITHMLNSKQQLFCAFVDFSKAFDYVTRENLWSKLIKLGIRGKILNIIRSIYENVKSRVKYMNKLSNSFECKLGVRQGECLSPFLFSMFVNDLEDVFVQNGVNGVDVYMFKLFLILYADDIVIFANCQEELQANLDILYTYCNKWNLLVNSKKTKVMIFKKGGRLPNNLSFTYGGDQLEIVKKFVYLGIVFTTGGSFSEAQNTLAGQALKAIFKLNKYLRKFTTIKVSHKLELFDKLVLPILNYGCETWGFHSGTALERVQLQFCKQLLGVKKCTQNDFIYGELGRTPLQNHRYYTVVKYWLKILQADSKRYIKIIYNTLYRDISNKPTSINWVSLLRDLLFRLGFPEVWYHQSVGDVKLFLHLVKQRIHDQFLQNWSSRLDNSSRAIFYSRIANFSFQPYIDMLNNRQTRNSLARLRLSSHRLCIETGRWSKPVSTPLVDRKCTFCNTLEDEYHFVMECCLFADLRKQLLPKYYWSRPNMYKFVELLKSENDILISKLGRFVNRSFTIRSDILYNNQI